MATNKDFTMKQYNGTDYDVLYPKNTSQQTLLNDSTLATALGITATNPEIDQALTEIVSKITALEDGAVKIQTGSYVGTGTYGASNPCSLTFDFAPMMAIMLGFKNTSNTFVSVFGSYYFTASSSTYNTNCVMYTQSVSTSYTSTVVFSYGQVNSANTFGKKSSDGKTYYWYFDGTATSTAGYQFNTSGYTYYWLAIG